jgi:hypothetical protein
MLSTLIDATDSQCHRSRMEIRRVGRSIDGNYLFFDKNLNQPIFQVTVDTAFVTFLPRCFF